MDAMKHVLGTIQLGGSMNAYRRVALNWLDAPRRKISPRSASSEDGDLQANGEGMVCREVAVITGGDGGRSGLARFSFMPATGPTPPVGRLSPRDQRRDLLLLIRQ